jgi:hypothetical protein
VLSYKKEPGQSSIEGVGNSYGIHTLHSPPHFSCEEGEIQNHRRTDDIPHSGFQWVAATPIKLIVRIFFPQRFSAKKPFHLKMPCFPLNPIDVVPM